MKLIFTEQVDGLTTLHLDPSTDTHIWPNFLLFQTHCKKEGELVYRALIFLLDPDHTTIDGIAALETIRKLPYRPAGMECLDRCTCKPVKE